MGGEAGEAAPPTLATEDGAKATTGCGWLLNRDEETTCILMYVGGVEIAKLVPKNPGAFSPGPTAWESDPKRQGGMRTRCPTNPSGDLAPTQGGAGA